MNTRIIRSGSPVARNRMTSRFFCLMVSLMVTLSTSLSASLIRVYNYSGESCSFGAVVKKSIGIPSGRASHQHYRPSYLHSFMNAVLTINNTNHNCTLIFSIKVTSAGSHATLSSSSAASHLASAASLRTRFPDSISHQKQSMLR